MTSITAVIPTLTNRKGLEHLLAELRKSNIPAIVIDNGASSSPENSSEVVYLPQTKNLGFAPAINLGVKQAKSEWILIANDDIELSDHSGSGQNTTGSLPEWKLKTLIETAKNHNWVAVSPVLRSPKGTIENIGYRVLPIGRAELNFDLQKNSDKDIDGLTMASLLIKKEVYEQLGGLDESFVAYLEDVDFFLRLKRAGFHFGVDQTVEVIHNHMTTSAKMKGFKQKRDFINWFKVIRKNWDKETWKKYWFKIMIERVKNLSGVIKNSI